MSSRIVYSTGLGSLCPNCRRAVRECVCPKGAPGAAKIGAGRVGRETQGRAGKGVTTITGLPLTLAEIDALATKLKKRCGSGGRRKSRAADFTAWSCGGGFVNAARHK